MRYEGLKIVNDELETIWRETITAKNTIQTLTCRYGEKQRKNLARITYFQAKNRIKNLDTENNLPEYIGHRRYSLSQYSSDKVANFLCFSSSNVAISSRVAPVKRFLPYSALMGYRVICSIVSMSHHTHRER